MSTEEKTTYENKEVSEEKFHTLSMKQKLNYINTILEQYIHYIYVHPVRLELVYKEIPNEQFEFENDEKVKMDDDDEELFDYMDNLVNQHKMNLVVFPEYKTLTVYSKNKGNSDTRGGGCGGLNIPVEEFTFTINSPTGITLKHLVEATYRMKGSKYDYWYELFGGLKVNNKKTNKEHLVLEANFGYGS